MTSSTQIAEAKALLDRCGGSIDIAHLTRTPPFGVGSFCRTVRNVMARMDSYTQVAVSHWDGAPQKSPGVILTSMKQLSRKQRALLKLPTRARMRFFSGIGGRGCLAYAWKSIEILRQLRPKLVLCYDEPWMGNVYRNQIDWPCRIIFKQHGLSYFMDSEPARQTYSWSAFDSVWALTNISYQFDRARMPYYEPLVRVVPNPIDTERFAPVSEQTKRDLRDRWKIPQEREVVLFLSVLRPKKGAHILIDSWADVLKSSPNAILWMVGGGDAGYEKYLRNMVAALGIQDSVVFQGRVPNEETHSIYQAADIYAFPTLFVEGMPLSLGEALASGLPCVASNHAVSTEAYDCEAVEFVSDPNISGAFVAPLVRWLQDPARRTKAAQTGRDFLVKHYSYEEILQQMEQAFARELRLIK